MDETEKNEPPPELLTVAEYAALWRISTETARRRIKAGAVPVVRSGKTLRIRREDALKGDS